jgi:hypothetical protein
LELARPILFPVAENAPYLPCYFCGFVASHDVAKQPVELAVSVNGVIRAVTRTYTDKKSNEMWAAMVAPNAFQRTADNICRIFVVKAIGNQITLHPVLDDTRLVLLAK